MRWLKIKKVKTIPQETIDNTKKIDSTYTVVDEIKNGENNVEELKEKDVMKKEDTDKKIDLHPKEPILEPIIEYETKREIIEKPILSDKEDNSILTPDSKGIMRLTEKAMDTSSNRQELIFKDASSTTSEKLAPQLASSPKYLNQGEWDDRKLTNITPLERIWLGYFRLLDPFEGGDWASNYANEYMALSMAIGGERAKLLVKMQMATSGGQSNFKKPDDKRNFIERHFTKRGQEPKEDDMNEL
jgi:hypothetical protein